MLHFRGTPIRLLVLFSFFFNAPAPTEIYTLSLHDALPISERDRSHGPPARLRLVQHPHRRSRADSDRAFQREDRKSTRLNSSHSSISYAVFCLKKKKTKQLINTLTTAAPKSLPPL